MVSAKQVLDIARGQLRVKESPAGSNRTKYGEWYGMDGQPWCAMFVSWVFDQAGMPFPPIQSAKGFAYCPYGENYFRQKGRLYKQPKVGDVVFFRWRGGVPDHVGIVESVQAKTVTTIEGNTSVKSQDNGGCVMRRIRPRTLKLSFARPNYNGIEQSIPRFSRILRLKTPYMRGNDVLAYQKLLNAKGYQLDTDGVFGPATERITRQFQRDKGLLVDGVLGFRTLKAVKERFNGIKANHQQTSQSLPRTEQFAIDILARTIYGEARKEDYLIKLAIAFTIINRVDSHVQWWGESVKEVCQHPNQYGCWTDARTKKIIESITRDNPNFEECWGIAKKALTEKVLDPSKGATHYYLKGRAIPVWAVNLIPQAAIGSYVFVRVV